MKNFYSDQALSRIICIHVKTATDNKLGDMVQQQLSE